MNDLLASRTIPAARSVAENCILFAAANEYFGLPLANVEGISAPPPVAAVPHAPPALLGAGNLAGQIVPIIDALRLLRPLAPVRAYDGRGEILRLRMSDGRVGLWVDHVEALIGNGSGESDGTFELLDPGSFLTTALASPALTGPEIVGAEPEGQAQPGSGAAGAAPPELRHTSVLMEVAGAAVALSQNDVLELLEHVPWTPVPRAPEAFLGVGIWRGAALPILSLSRLLGGTEVTQPGGFALARTGGRHLLLAVERVIGLGSGADYAQIDLSSLIPEELRRIVLGFAPPENAAPGQASVLAAESAQYLSLILGRQQFAFPVSAVERVIEASPLIPLPRIAGDDPRLADTAGAIELRGQIIPVAALHRRLGIADSEIRAPSAYLIVRSNNSHSAVGVDRIGELMSLPREDIASPPGDPGLIAGVAVLGGTEPLSIIAPEHLWRTF